MQPHGLLDAYLGEAPVEEEEKEETSKFANQQHILIDSFCPSTVAKPVQKRKKENAIDDNPNISLAFLTRKLMLKAWKSFLVTKMLGMHKKYLNRVAKQY